jgi:hypothetical protein
MKAITIKNTSIGWYISALVYGRLVERNYYGFTKRAALSLFKEEFKV